MTLTIKIKETAKFVKNHKFAILVTALGVTTTSTVLMSKQLKIQHDLLENIHVLTETIYIPNK